MSAPVFGTQVYDADQIRLTLGGYSISKGAGATGYADGEFLRVTQPTQSFTSVEGTDGTLVRSKTNTRKTQATIRLLQTSASNAVLSAMLTADENLPNGGGIGTFVVEDLQGTTKIVASAAWITGPPEVVYDREAEAREWPIEFMRATRLDGGN